MIVDWRARLLAALLRSTRLTDHAQRQAQKCEQGPVYFAYCRHMQTNTRVFFAEKCFGCWQGQDNNSYLPSKADIALYLRRLSTPPPALWCARCLAWSMGRNKRGPYQRKAIAHFLQGEEATIAHHTDLKQDTSDMLFLLVASSEAHHRKDNPLRSDP